MCAIEGNTFLTNKGLNPVVNFNFMLRVEAVMDVPCKSVRAFTKENEYEYIQEGGLNDYVHMRRKPISKPFTFQVERYVATDYIDPLPNGAELILPLLLFVSHEGNNFLPEAVSRCYTFTGCTVTAKEYGALSSEQSGLLVETTTIAYHQLLVIDTPHNRKTVDSVSKMSNRRGSLDATPPVEPRLFDAKTKLANKPNVAVEPRLFDAKTKLVATRTPPAEPRLFDPRIKK